MSNPAEVYAHVLPAVQLIIADKGYTAETPDLDAHVHGALWPYVTHAVREAFPSAPAPSGTPPKKDGRSKTWEIVVRFGIVHDANHTELVAETDPEIIQGTGKLPKILEKYATEMYPDDVSFPSALTVNAIKDKIPQLRNNLGRQGRATLRFEYVIDGVDHLCQVDVTKPGA